MNKNKKNRKGFTIVELVIVIAVIGILATVLVPTFGDVISKANMAAVKQEAKSAFTNYVAAKAETGAYVDDCYVKVTKNNVTYYVEIADGGVKGEPSTTAPTAGAACLNLLDGEMAHTHGTVANNKYPCGVAVSE